MSDPISMILAGKGLPAKIIHRGVFIERRNYGKWITHTGISLFVPGEFDTQEDAVKAVDAAMDKAAPSVRGHR